MTPKALTHLVYIPHAYVVDRFKWDVFSSAVAEDDLNCHWVKLRMDIQGRLYFPQYSPTCQEKKSDCLIGNT